MDENERILLPPRYYLDYFLYLIDFITDRSAHLLGEEDQAFIATFRALDTDAQCLFVRMANRKGEHFRLDKLQYTEIEDYAVALDQLETHRFISLDLTGQPEVFGLFTKGELHRIFPEKGLNNLYKNELLELLAEEAATEDYLRLQEHCTLIKFEAQEQVEFLKLLFFGHYKAMMTEFVIRDIGNIKLENLEGHRFTPWFDSREEALAVFFLSRWKSTLKQAVPLMLPEEILEVVSPVNWSDYLQHPKARKTGDKLMLLLGEYFEKCELQEEALVYYSLARKHPARERRIRIHEKLGQTETARELAEVALEHPYNASERLFMKDFLARKSARTYRSTTLKIKESPVIAVADLLSGRVEEKALEHFRNRGYAGAHVENYLWRALFGLFFWEELFDHTRSSFHHPLQRMPSDLYDESFYLKRGKALKQKVNSYSTKESFGAYIAETYRSKRGINNPLVSWDMRHDPARPEADEHSPLLQLIHICLEHLPVQGIGSVLLEMAKNVKDNSAGFPDLFIWNGTDYHFYEIKSPNDHLSPQQLFWIDFLNDHGIRADILRVQPEEIARDR